MGRAAGAGFTFDEQTVRNGDRAAVPTELAELVGRQRELYATKHGHARIVVVERGHVVLVEQVLAANVRNRTREHLGTTDKGIVLYRRLLVDAIRKNQAGEKPLMVLDTQGAREITGPPAVDGIGPSDRLEEYWKAFDVNRRKKSAWG